MKKMRVVALVALTLAALMLLSACSAGAKVADVSKIIEKNATYKNSDLVPAKSEKIYDVADMSVSKTAGTLVLFVGEEEYVMYNTEKGKTVLTLDLPEEGNVEPTLDSLTIKGKTFAFLTVWNTDKDGVVTTELYDATGDKVASAAYKTSAKTAADLVYFNGKCYRFAADGMMGEAFAYSVLNAMPNIIAYNEDYYLAREDARYVVYDRLMLPVSAFDIPAYAQVNVQTMLPDGDVLVQYRYELPKDAKHYDCIIESSTYIDGDSDDFYMDAMTKWDVVTLLVNPKNGKAKELKCDYLLMSARGNQMKDTSKSGLDLDKVAVICTAAKIVDERLDTSVRTLVTLDKNGNVTEYALNGARVIDVKMVANERYVVTTDSRKILVDNKGNVIGDVSNGTVFGKYVLGDGKVYDMNLKVVTDLDDGNYSVERVMDEALLLRNTDGAYAMFTSRGDVTILTSEKGESELYATFDEYVVVVSEGKYEVYGQNGNALLYVRKDGEMRRIYANDNAIIVSMPELVNDEYKITYYAFTAEK